MSIYYIITMIQRMASRDEIEDLMRPFEHVFGFGEGNIESGKRDRVVDTGEEDTVWVFESNDQL